ncbi:MAG: cobalamin biosynthesis protein CbiG [Methylococcales bacterium]|jgi:cobalt-precorrin 5A hydrolase|nr:cobalamin biosynthesis protein CbiG [Methylococcales bacterium]MBT7442414.1 cobalamin biosynthesis protein CbiG [Methylococcales bacterium]
MTSFCIISLTEAGRQLANKLQSVLTQACECTHQPKPFGQWVQQRFQQGQPIIFIGATGIITRTLAPVLQDKHTDPAVIVLDERGQYIIPLLSGHEGGANALAATVAKALQAQLVITTANHYLDPIYTIGMGCERDCDSNHLKALALSCLSQANLQPEHIQNLSSLEVKADEAGLIQLGQTFNWPFTTHTTAALRQVEHQLSVRSNIVFNAVGVYGVAEAAALVSASTLSEQPAELIITKQKTPRATCAIARSYPIQHTKLQRTAP